MLDRQVRWVKGSIDNGGNTVEVNEGNGWVNYQSSELYTPDSWMSTGYATFLRCVRAGYEVAQSRTQRAA